MSLYLGDTPISANIPSRNIGQIIESTIPLTDAGLHLLDGSLISSGSYSAFVTYIAGLVSTYPDLFETEANWQTSVSTYGVCGKFVYDSVNGTVRLPKITGFTEGTIDPTTLGDLVEAGLPNIEGWTGMSKGGTDASCMSGPFKNDVGSHLSIRGASDGTDTNAIYFNASLSNSIYDNSTTVQPQSIKVLYYVCIATSTKTQIEVDIDEIATDLNGKADVDLSNVSNTAGFRKLVEVYNNGASWYKVYREYDPSNGNYIGLWCEQGGYANAVSTDYQTCEIVFLKEFIDTNYVFLHENNTTNWSTTVNGVPAYTAKTTASIKIFAYSPYTNGSNWRACGYIS